MATTTQENDFDRAKRRGKEFLATGQPCAGGGTGQGQRRSDATEGLRDDPGEMTARTTRFHPPPGWPPAPAGWVAPPGWQPDPSWPEPPPGWQLRAEDHPGISPKAQDALLAMAGGTAVVLGSLMPWVSFNSAAVDVKPAAKAASVVLGLVVVALGFALRAAPLPGRVVAGTAALGLSSLAGLLYVGFILVGVNGVPGQDPFGYMTTAKWFPNIGIILAAAGCGAAFVAAIRSFCPPPGLTAIHASEREREGAAAVTCRIVTSIRTVPSSRS